MLHFIASVFPVARAGALRGRSRKRRPPAAPAVVAAAAAAVGLAMAGCSTSPVPRAGESAVPAATAPGARTRIERAADLPKFSYPVRGQVEDVVRQAERFAPLAAQIARDDESVLARYDIADRAAQRDLVARLAVLDYLAGRYDSTLRRLQTLQSLQEKPADKLMSGLRLGAMATVAQSTPPQSPGFGAAVAREIRRRLDAMPFAVVENDVKSGKAGLETLGAGRIVGQMQQVLQPIVDQSGSLSSDFAPSLVNARFALTSVLPIRDALVPAYAGYIAAHSVPKKDIWAARDVSVPAGGAPVRIGIWDSGVDTPLFGRQVALDAAGKPLVIGFDKYAKPANTTLQTLPPALSGRLPQMTEAIKGLSDLQSAIDSPEASAIKRRLAELTPAQYQQTIEELRLAGNHVHGTHVAGIALAGNPNASIVTGRIEFGWTLKPDPCPSRELAERDAANYGKVVDFFQRTGVKVVNMSWGGDADAIAADMEQCGIGKTPEERRKLAQADFDMAKRALTQAMASAPGILFVTAAGNSNQDASFVDDIPASIVLPNLLTVGAVDLAGEEAPFTSYGPTVRLHANGYQVPSMLPGGARVALSGTSMASPQVAGLAAKLLAVRPQLTPAQLIEIMVSTADRSADGRRVLMNPRRALEAAQRR